MHSLALARTLLAQACSLCPIQNSLTRPTRPTRPTRLTCLTCLTRLTYLTRLTRPTYLTCPKNLPVRLALPPIQNSEFKIHNSQKKLWQSPKPCQSFFTKH